eukprot:SAG11_NODE_2528_length_3253_cov_13.746988_1_plen_72_part_00
MAPLVSKYFEVWNTHDAAGAHTRLSAAACKVYICCTPVRMLMCHGHETCTEPSTEFAPWLHATLRDTIHHV